MSAPLFIDHTLVDPRVQAQIMARCQAERVPDEPTSVANDLGMLNLPDGTSKQVWLVHAADTVLLDEYNQVALITRRHNPGRGKLALPGGLLDATPHGLESSLTAALREAVEETGISQALLNQAQITQLGHRRSLRPFDIRCAWSNLPGTPVRQGDLFSVSTLGFCARLHGRLQDIAFKAGDDAVTVCISYVNEITPNSLAVPDHMALIQAAMAAEQLK